MGKTKEDYIKSWNIIHDNKYDYSLVNISDKKVKIICPTHGEFTQNKYSHNKYGCFKCGAEMRAKNQRLSKDEFIRKSNDTHDNKYDYSKVEYRNNHTKIIIICDTHGEFKQTPGSHLSGNGCPKCGTESASEKQSYNTETFIKK